MIPNLVESTYAKPATVAGDTTSKQLNQLVTPNHAATPRYTPVFRR